MDLQLIISTKFDFWLLTCTKLRDKFVIFYVVMDGFTAHCLKEPLSLQIHHWQVYKSTITPDNIATSI